MYRIVYLLAFIYFPLTAFASFSDLDIELPSENVDGSAIQVDGLDFLNVTCGGTETQFPVSVNPGDVQTVTMVLSQPAGDYDCVATVTDFDGDTSANSNMVTKRFASSVPLAPVIQQ